MRRLASALIVCFVYLVAWAGDAKAQRGVDWMTGNGDAQRSAWVRADAKISKESLQDPQRKPGFQARQQAQAVELTRAAGDA